MNNFRSWINRIRYRVWICVFIQSSMIFSTSVLGTPELNKMSSSASTLGPDLSDITWAHAVNSREQLENVLSGALDFIEADVSMGHTELKQYGDSIPIMAHPPDSISDISLQDWLKLVIKRDTGKGVKLDFKSLDVVKPSLMILQQQKSLNFSLWLNADILKGPVAPNWPPVEAKSFLALCNQYFADAVLSVGWTTEWYQIYPRDTWHYEWQQVRKMADIIRCFDYDNSSPNFTFPVRAIFASRSIKQLQWLLSVIPRSSLTIWNDARDPLTIDDLIRIRKCFPRDKVYYDVPHPSYKKFLEIKNNISYEIECPESATGFSVEQWRILTRGLGQDCSSFTYVGNDTIVFGKSLYSAVLLKDLLLVDEKHSLDFQGRIQFFKEYNQDIASVGNGQITLVIVDVSLFSKNVTDTGSLDLTGSDTDVLWSAVNASHLYTFDQQSFDKCHLFKLNSSNDRSFQTWTMYCSDLIDQTSFDETTDNAVQRVPYTKRVVLPKVPFMIGFVSNGSGHAVIWDLKIRKADKHSHNSSSSLVEISVGFLSLIFLSIIMSGLIT